MQYRVLLVEDDVNLLEIITDYFSEKSGGEIEIVTVSDGDDAVEVAEAEHYDLMLLDVMLPGMDGFSICREIRKNSEIPIIFLTARQSECDRLHGYSLGCDDYMVKPFSMPELYAKVNAWIRRVRGFNRVDGVVVGDIAVDPYKIVCSVRGTEINLPPKEFGILRVLAENKGKTVSRDTLLVRLWGYDFDGNERVVDNHVKKLRAALGDASAQIKTVRKVGYRIEEK